MRDLEVAVRAGPILISVLYRGGRHRFGNEGASL